MPVHRTPGGGYQWGNSGKVYYGKGAKEKAEKQGRAARAHGYGKSRNALKDITTGRRKMK